MRNWFCLWVSLFVLLMYQILLLLLLLLVVVVQLVLNFLLFQTAVLLYLSTFELPSTDAASASLYQAILMSDDIDRDDIGEYAEFCFQTICQD